MEEASTPAVGRCAGLAREGYAPIITITNFPEGHEEIAGPEPILRKLVLIQRACTERGLPMPQ